MSRVLVIVWNKFTNDKRVLQISRSLVLYGYSVKVIAAKDEKGVKASEKIQVKRSHKKEHLRRTEFGNCFQYSSYLQNALPSDDKNAAESYPENLYISVNRIPLFSSLYSTRSSVRHKTSSHSTTEGYGEHLQGEYHSPFGRLKNSVKNNKIRIIVTAFLNWFCFNTGVLIRGLLYRPHFVYCNDLNTLTAGYITARICRSAIIYDSHEIWLDGASYCNSTFIRKFMWQKLESYLIRRADQIVTTNSMRAEILEKRYEIEGINVIRNSPYYQEVEKNTLLRKGIPDEAVLFLYCGAITIERGILMILEVIEKIPDAYLVYMGNGVAEPVLVNEIEKKMLTDRVFVKKSVHPLEVINYASSADVGLQLLPNININHYSTISNKLLEYIMAECAVIASDFPEIRKIVVDNNLGIVVDPEDKEAIEHACRELVNDRKKLEYFKNNCRKVKIEYCWEQDEKRLLEIVEKLRTKRVTN